MNSKPTSDKNLIYGIVFSMFLWGLSWPSSKVLSNYCTVVNFTVYRYFIVVVTLLLLLIAMRINLKMLKGAIIPIVASGALLAIYSYLFVTGLKKGTPGAGGVLVTTLNPIMAYIIGIALSRKLPSRNESIGLFLGLIAGTVLLELWGNAHALLESGNLYFLLAAFTWSVMAKFTSQGAKYGSSIAFSFWQYIITMLCLLPLMDIHEAMEAVHIKDSLFWGNLFFGSAIVTTIATTVYFYSTTRLGAEKASSFIFLVPLGAAVSSALLLGEHIYAHTIIGGALGMTAVYMINKKRTQPKAE